MDTQSIFLAIGGDIGERCLNYLAKTGVEITDVLRRGEKFRTTPADFLISIQYDKLFSEQDLSQYKKAYNFHFSMLPLNRGCLPINWAIWNGDPIGVTLHEMTDGIDDGCIIDKIQVQDEVEETAYTAYKKCCKACYELLTRNIGRLLRDDYTATPQDHSKATYHKKGEFPCDKYLDGLNKWDKERLQRALWFPEKEGARYR